MRNYIDYKRRNSWVHKMETPDVMVWTDRLTPGTIEGIIPEEASYYSDVYTTGNEWNYGSKIKFERKLFTGDVLHRLLTGVEFQADNNTGSGKTYDILKPPEGKLKSRPRSFDDTQGTVQMAFFAEDRLTGEWVFPYTLDVGFRIDSYNPTGLDLTNLFKDKDVFKARQGTFFNPRLGLKLKLTPNTQLRFTFGKSSKTPAISSIYPENYFLDVQDYTIRATSDTTDTTITLVSTYMYDCSAKNLKGYQSTKFELAVDQQIGDVGLSLAAYYQESKGSAKSPDIPFIYNRYYWPNWDSEDSEDGKTLIETITTTRMSYDRARNLGWSKGSGLEFSLKTHRIKSLNMRFRISAAFNFRKYGNKKYRAYGDVRNLTAGDTLSSGWVVPEDMQIIPYYSPYSKWRQKTVINYNIDYIAKPLGIWLTFKAQQVLWDQKLEVLNPKLSADGYFKDGDNIDINSETSTLMGLDRSYSKSKTTVDKTKTNDNWLFSIVAS
ncbi:MAG: TonB-dependent receptor, partial [Calditrichales bacterium]|nr:TonB-dependent receptor [Calditrichales bacterium]